MLAEQSYKEAYILTKSDPKSIGIGCTATLATDRPKRGEHRCHVAIMTARNAEVYTLVLAKDLRTRSEEETIVSRLVIQALAEGAGLQSRLDLLIDDCERLDVAYELPIINADKPALTELQVRLRVLQFADWATVILTKTPTFSEKATILPQRTFIIGIDTASRIVEPRFYGGTEENLNKALSEFQEQDCHFLVAGRQDGSDFITLSDVNIPDFAQDLFEQIPEQHFRSDLSSTQIRREGLS